MWGGGGGDHTIPYLGPSSCLRIGGYRHGRDGSPHGFYAACLSSHDNVGAALDIVDQLPTLNRSVLKYFIRFLQVSHFLYFVSVLIDGKGKGRVLAITPLL